MAKACAAQTTPPALVVVSSLAAAGPAPEDRPRVETDPVRPTSDYGRSKRAGELAAAELRGPGANLASPRPPIVFGEGDKDMLGDVPPDPLVGSRADALAERASDVDDPRRGSFRRTDRRRRARAADFAGRARDRTTRPTASIFWRRIAQPTYAEWGRLIADSLGRRRFRSLPAPELLLWGAAGLADAWALIRRRRGIFNIDKVREATAGSWICSGTAPGRNLGLRSRRASKIDSPKPRAGISANAGSKVASSIVLRSLPLRRQPRVTRAALKASSNTPPGRPTPRDVNSSPPLARGGLWSPRKDFFQRTRPAVVQQSHAVMNADK